MTECVICAKPFTPYRPQQRCCGPSCRKQHKSTYGTERQRARRASLVPADATNGRKRQCDAVTPYSARPARSYRFGETAAILPGERWESLMEIARIAASMADCFDDVCIAEHISALSGMAYAAERRGFLEQEGNE